MAAKPVDKSLLQQAVNEVAMAGGNREKAARQLRIPAGTLKSRLQMADRAEIIADPTLVTDALDQVKYKLAMAEKELNQARLSHLSEDSIRKEILNISSAVTMAQIPDWVLKEKKAGSPGVPSLFLSDLHWGEVVNSSQINGVNSYNLKIAHERLVALASTSTHLLNILSPKMEYPGLVLILGGDMISGNIHDELATTNELNTMPTILDLYGSLSWFIQTMADKFGKLFIPAVSGNHGRDTMKIWNKDRHATSFDWLLYNFLAKRFEDDKRITFLIPDGPDAYYKIYNHRYLLTHGDKLGNGGTGMIGALGPLIHGDHRRRTRNSQIGLEYDTLLAGHFHQYVHLNKLIVNGSLVGYNEYAYTMSFPFEVPQQALWITHPVHGITYRMPVKFQNEMRSKAAPWVSLK